MITASVLRARALWLLTALGAVVMLVLGWLYGTRKPARSVLAAQAREKAARQRAAEAERLVAEQRAQAASAEAEASAAKQRAQTALDRANAARAARERLERQMEENDAELAAQYNRRRGLAGSPASGG